MATIRQRNNQWQVQVRQKNHPLLSKTFIYKKDALQWAKECERTLQQDDLEFKTNIFPSFSSVIDKYIKTVSCHKHGAKEEIIRLRALQKQKFSKLSFNLITPKVMSEYRDRRLQEVKASTLLREMNIIQHIFYRI